MTADETRPERYWLTYTFAVSLTAIVACYGAWGWLGVNEPFKAILCLVAQGLANGNAVLARRAFNKHRPAMGIGALLMGSGCATWSAISLHHAWTLDGSEIHWSMTAFLALLEPVMFWFVEEVKLAQAPADPARAADQIPANEPARARAHLRSIAGGLGAAAALAMVPHQAQAAEPVRHEPVTQRATRSILRDQEPDRAQAKLLLAQGRSAWMVHKATGVPLSTLKRWARAA